MTRKDSESTDSTKLRIDKWLWAARFFKTRSLSADAVEGGKVLVNQARVKPAKNVTPGDMLAIRLGPYTFEVEVLALSDKRGPAPQAQLLYRETDDSRKKREQLAAELKAQARPAFMKGRPTKRDRRDLDKIKVGAW